MRENISPVAHLAQANVAIPGYVPGTFKADAARSEIAFAIRHLGVSKVRGRFTAYDVMIVTGEDPLDSAVFATIALASVDTGNKRRDHHLRSADYFEVEKYPTMNYRSAGVRPTGDGWVIDGALSVRGHIQPVRLAVDLHGFGPDPSGGTRVSLSASAELNRRDFGIEIAGGGAIVSDKVSISLGIEAVCQS